MWLIKNNEPGGFVSVAAVHADDVANPKLSAFKRFVATVTSARTNPSVKYAIGDYDPCLVDD